MHTRIPYRVEEHDAGILTVHPSIPDLAYAEVTYPTEVSTRPVLVSEPGHSTFLLLTEPGVARAGPLPVGKYWLVLDWDGASPARLASQGKAKRVELQAGFQHVRW